MSNPLLENFDTPFESAPFSKIKTEHFIPALKHSIDLDLDEIDTVVKNTATPSFENTLEALENCGNLIGRNSSLLFNLNSAETSDALQKVAQEAAPLLTAFQNDIRLNETLFKRIKFVYEKENRALLSPEPLTLPEKEYKGFVPSRSVVITGSYTKSFPAGAYQVPCALIIGKRKESTDKKTSLNEALRTHDVAV